jgi:GNAT superfamily N-acetyltransferase
MTMKIELQIRPAIHAERGNILPLLYGMGSVDADDKVKTRFVQLIERPDHHLPIAIYNEELVGYAWAQDYGPHLRSGNRTARLHDLFVRPDYRKLGVGTALFMAIKTWAEQAGIRYLEWQASQTALGFYERLGYKGDPCPQPDYPFFEIEFTQ